MVTQTMQDIIGHEPFHWRGDRAGIEEFNQTFTNLQAAATNLTTAEMSEFKTFLASITFPPNRFRNFDNTLSTNLPLPGHRASGLGQLPAGTQLPDGNARRGFDLFSDNQATFGNLCMECHRPPAGLGEDQVVPGELKDPIIAVGPHGEHHVETIGLPRNRDFAFKIVQLRNLPDKIGMDTTGTNSRAGFGFSFAGRVDTLSRFLAEGFNRADDQDIADLIALLLSFAGSDFSINGSRFALGLPSQDAPAALGKQLTVTNSDVPPLLSQILSVAATRSGHVELIASGQANGVSRGWLYSRVDRRFQSDRQNEILSVGQLMSLASPKNELTFMLVPGGSGKRLSIDTDEDGFFNGDELDGGSDPANPYSIPLRALARIDPASHELRISWNSVTGQTYRVQFTTNLTSRNWADFASSKVADGPESFVTDAVPPDTQRFYRIEVLQP